MMAGLELRKLQSVPWMRMDEMSKRWWECEMMAGGRGGVADGLMMMGIIDGYYCPLSTVRSTRGSVFCSTTELMCFWVCLTRFTSGRSGIAVPRPRESLYFIYSTDSLDFMPSGGKKVKNRSFRDNCRKTESQHRQTTADMKHGIKHTFFSWEMKKQVMLETQWS